jgi:hypothetical protein
MLYAPCQIRNQAGFFSIDIFGGVLLFYISYKIIIVILVTYMITPSSSLAV